MTDQQPTASTPTPEAPVVETPQTKRPRGRHRTTRTARWSLRTKLVAGFVGAAMAGGVAYAATNWVVGLGANSSGQGQAAAIAPITIVASATPSPTNQLYPGATGDVVVTVSNPNSFPVTVTAVNLPTNTTYADAYTTNALSTPTAGCASGTPSYVTWNYSTATSGTTHSLSTPFTVAATGSLQVTFTNDAAMGLTAPAACAAQFFKMPSLTGVGATGGAATVSSGPVTSGWTS